jgi:hypothetical protein
MGFNGRGGQQAFANFLGVDRGRWNNVECGAPLSKEMALRIVRKFPGVTLDWLFLGRMEGLTAEMARALSEPSNGNDGWRFTKQSGIIPVMVAFSAGGDAGAHSTHFPAEPHDRR